MVLNLLILLIPFSLVTIVKAAPSLALPGCQEKCGNVTIPYPFGITDGCFRDVGTGYNIPCDARNDGTPLVFGWEVLDISLLEAQATIREVNKRFRYSTQCFNVAGVETSDFHGYSLSETIFTFSAKHNKLIAIGCDTIAYIESNVPAIGDFNFTSGCISLCDSVDSVRTGSCSGFGCCQTLIPLGLKEFGVRLESKYKHTRILKSNPCSFAFVGNQDQFTFDPSDLSADTLEKLSVPMVWDWAIGNQTCEEAARDGKSYACGPNSYCSNSINGHGYGYLCHCKVGFEGNPYLPHVGCQDINECDNNYNTACDHNAICNNTLGSYSCHCQEGYNGDGWKNGTRCTKDLRSILVIEISAGTISSFLVLLIFSWFLYWAIQRRRKLREKIFQQNGGFLLQQQMDTHKGIKDIAKIFTTKQLKKATKNFDESQILGKGGFGIVYKGILPGGIFVAIKKSKTMDKGQIIQFINEVYILSQINHRHVVKLLGCCLETEVPLLVYEFISNGTLFQHIHGENQTVFLSWENRLRIAAETADALAYLHSSHSVPIFHRDVKSSNILLDNKYRAKVSDFGASRLVPFDQTQKMTVIQVTYGYLDPECYLTGQLTDKSDVYSFGVVLVELLTGKRPILLEKSGEYIALANYFVSSVKGENLFHILDDRILNDGNKEQLLVVAELARNCLEEKRDDRPTMKEVAKELDSLKILYEQQFSQYNHEGTESFVGEPSTSSANATFETEIGYSFN